jgi:FkbM family methyltransferase
MAALKGPTEMIITETGETIRAVLYPLTIGNAATYEVFVPSDANDDISNAIAGQRYSFPEHYSLLLKLASAGSRILDLGAHLGTFSLFAAAHGYQVLAIEASPRNAALLKATIAKNRLENVRVVWAAVSDHEEELLFVQAGAYSHVAGPLGASGGIRLPALTVDGLVSRHGWSGVEFVKMDIEGSEVAAIDGMTRLMAGNEAPVILYESNGHTLSFLGKTPRDLRSCLASSGYRCFLVRPHQLVAMAPDDLQLECNVDCVAMRRWPVALADWEIAEGMDAWTRRFFAQRSCMDSNPHVRAYVGRTLQAADPAFLADWRIASSLNALKKDPEPAVRQAVVWWHRERRVFLWAVGHYVRAAGRRFKSLIAKHNRIPAD